MIIKIKKNKGFVILFAVTLSAILLSIALSVAQVALKEINFGTSAKDTNDAFFAADTGDEQALYNDNKLNLYVPAIGTIQTWTLSPVTGLNNNNTGCAIVNITKDYSNSTSIATTIISDGYNVGDSLCNSTNPNRVAREIKTTY